MVDLTFTEFQQIMSEYTKGMKDIAIIVGVVRPTPFSSEMATIAVHDRVKQIPMEIRNTTLFDYNLECFHDACRLVENMQQQ